MESTPGLLLYIVYIDEVFEKSMLMMLKLIGLMLKLNASKFSVENTLQFQLYFIVFFVDIITHCKVCMQLSICDCRGR